jgi:hypothetical protein
MGIRQLEEFLGQADQKGFWIFTYANLAGGFIGAFVGNSLLDRVAPSFKLLGIVAGVLLGLMTTWKVKGHPIYKWALSYIMFVLRRYLKLGLGDHMIDAALYYRARTVEQTPFMLVAARGGKPVPVLVHRGSGSSVDAFDSLLLSPPAEGRAWEPGAGARTPQTDGARTVADPGIHSGALSSNGRSPHLNETGEQLDREYSDWDL